MDVQRVLVVGAGIGGLAAATALAQHGVEVEVAEIAAEQRVHGVGINQPANALRVLRRLGVLDQCRDAGFDWARLQFHDWHGRLIVECPSHLGGDVPANNALPRVDLHRILASAAETAGVKVTYNLTVQDLVNTDDAVEVTLTDGRSGRYDLVVCFDGVRSQLRRTVFGTRYEPAFTGYAVFRVTMPRPSEVTNAQLFQGPGTKAGLIPLSEHSMYLLHVVPAPGNPHHDPARLHELLVDHLAGYRGLIGELRDSITGPEGIVYSPLEEVLLPSPWFRGRVIVLGDAAHACAPHLTQGAAMALEDAAVLADELATDRPIAASLGAFTERRLERVMLVQQVSDEILFSEMAITAETLPQAAEQMRAALPGQLREVEMFLNQPC